LGKKIDADISICFFDLVWRFLTRHLSDWMSRPTISSDVDY
jgi:hypothetical protein